MADIIYFKDGMKTVCHGKAWEEKDEVKCDYDGVILTYRKEDVDQIHRTISPEEADSPPLPVSKSAADVKKEKPELIPASNVIGGGIAFYDPRRKFKYWSSPTAKHRNYKEAVNALAKEFGQSPQWVEDHIGNTNDLVIIRNNLKSPARAPAETATPSPGNDPPAHELFYNPRRDYKYQISAKKKFHTYKEAINALALEFEATPKWVEAHMGPENDILLIRRNLNRKKSNSTE